MHDECGDRGCGHCRIVDLPEDLVESGTRAAGSLGGDVLLHYWARLGRATEHHV
jgi:hypothetical protein